MMRLFSILLLLAGLLVAGYGGSRLLEIYNPQAKGLAAAPAAMDEAAPPDDAATEMAGASETEAMEAAPPAEAEVPAPKPESMARSLPAPTLDSEVFNGESAPMDEPMFSPEVSPEIMASAPPAAAVDATAAFVYSLKTVQVAHETPATAEYKRPFEAVLAIDATGDSTAADALPGHGVIEEGTAKVSKLVEARLSGSGFAIKAMTPEQQTISPLTENTWRWSVTPLTAGSQELTFDIYAIDDGPAVPLRTFHNTVTVQVTGLNRAIAFADQANPLAVFLGGVGSVLAGLFGAVRFVRRR